MVFSPWLKPGACGPEWRRPVHPLPESPGKGSRTLFYRDDTTGRTVAGHLFQTAVGRQGEMVLVAATGSVEKDDGIPLSVFGRQPRKVRRRV